MAAMTLPPRVWIKEKKRQTREARTRIKSNKKHQHIISTKKTLWLSLYKLVSQFLFNCKEIVCKK